MPFKKLEIDLFLHFYLLQTIKNIPIKRHINADRIKP